jgi:squalene-associated FAD-dependent desaturase
VAHLDRRVAIVGAGYAGMAAAVALAERGVRVTVLESGPVPGGRARRVVTQGRTLDNGQHIFVGAYTELFRLMRAVRVRDDAVLRMPLEIRYANGPALRAAPFGLLGALLFARGIPLAERLGAVRFMRAMKRSRFRLADDVPVADLLRAHGQDGRIGHYLWAPLCVSALNTPLDRASANVFLAALRDTLDGPAGSSDLVLPRVDLSRLFPEPAVEFVRARGGEVRFGATVRDLGSLDCDRIIVAVGPHQLRGLLPDAVEFDYQPIYTCYLQYGEDARLPFPMLGMADGLVQWVFDRGALLGEKGRLACVISAQGDHQQMTHDALAERCDQELRRAFPQLPSPKWSQVIAEKRATIACTPKLKRPSQTVTTGVLLAGDYTDPEYPPTLEAAVRSGIRAAGIVISQIA